MTKPDLRRPVQLASSSARVFLDSKVRLLRCDSYRRKVFLKTPDLRKSVASAQICIRFFPSPTKHINARRGLLSKNLIRGNLSHPRKSAFAFFPLPPNTSMPAEGFFQKTSSAEISRICVDLRSLFSLSPKRIEARSLHFPAVFKPATFTSSSMII
jgi:hypothetical protein